MRLKLAAATAALAWACAAGAVAAKDLPAGGMTLQEVAAWLQDQGYKAELKTDDSGDRYIASAAEGVNFDVHAYDCTGGRCTSIQMVAGFDLDDGLSLEQANDWNRGKRYAKAYLDDERDPYIDFDINLSPGGTEAALNDNLGVWLMMLPAFRSHIGW